MKPRQLRQCEMKGHWGAEGVELEKHMKMLKRWKVLRECEEWAGFCQSLTPNSSESSLTGSGTPPLFCPSTTVPRPLTLFFHSFLSSTSKELKLSLFCFWDLAHKHTLIHLTSKQHHIDLSLPTNHFPFYPYSPPFYSLSPHSLESHSPADVELQSETLKEGVI